MSVAKTIAFELSDKGINDAIKELRMYRMELERKTKELQRRIAERISQEALANFAGAVCDDLVGGGTRSASVSISVEAGETTSVVIASGADAAFCEFGAGVYHNGAVGSSPHPKGAELGMTIGSFGKGYGARRVWGYYEGDALVLTRGTPASMPMYNAFKAVCAEIYTIAREVFE